MNSEPNQLTGRLPAALIASFGMHLAVLAAQFIAFGPGVGEPAAGPQPEPIPAPMYVTIVSEPAVETVAAAVQPAAELEPVLDAEAEIDVEAEEAVEAVEVVEAVPEPPVEISAEVQAPPPVASPVLAGIRPPRKPLRPKPAVRKSDGPTVADAKPAPSARPAPEVAAAAVTFDAKNSVGADKGRGQGGAAAAGDVVSTAPYYLDHPEPPYPPGELRRRREGVVVVRVSVTAAGRVAGVEVLRSSGISAFDRAARTAVRLWHFRPATVNGVAVPGIVEVPVRFTLR